MQKDKKQVQTQANPQELAKSLEEYIIKGSVRIIPSSGKPDNETLRIQFNQDLNEAEKQAIHDVIKSHGFAATQGAILGISKARSRKPALGSLQRRKATFRVQSSFTMGKHPPTGHIFVYKVIVPNPPTKKSDFGKRIIKGPKKDKKTGK